MCDFASFVLYKDPREGFKIKSLDLRSHSPTVSALHKEFGINFDDFAQIEITHEDSRPMRVLPAYGLRSEGYTDASLRAEVRKIVKTLPDLIRHLISQGYEPVQADLESAVQHGAWKTVELLREYVSVDEEEMLEVLLEQGATLEEVANLLEGKKFTPKMLSDAISGGQPEVVKLIASKVNPSTEDWDDAAESEELMLVLLGTGRKPRLSENGLNNASSLENNFDNKTYLKLALAANKTLRKAALLFALWDERRPVAKKLVAEGTRLNRTTAIHDILKNGNFQMVLEYFKLVAPTKKELVELKERAEDLPYWNNEHDKAVAAIKRIEKKWAV